MKYLVDTNAAYVVGGQVGAFHGDVSAVTTASNASAWSLEIRFVGTTDPGVPTDVAYKLEVPYGRSVGLNLAGLGNVQSWFLSDQELAEFDRVMPK